MNELGIHRRVDNNQTTELLGFARILRKSAKDLKRLLVTQNSSDNHQTSGVSIQTKSLKCKI